MQRTSELHALANLRRSLIVVAISYGYFLYGFGISRRSDVIPNITEASIGLAFICFLVGLVFSRKDSGLWLIIGSFSLVTIYVVVDPLVKTSWMQLSVLNGILVLSVSFMYWQKRLALQIFLISGLAIFNLLAHFFGATSLLRSGSFLGRGSISSVMVLATGLFAVYGWKRMLLNAQLNDERIQSLVSDIETLEKSQASQKYWRELVIRVHETTLNTIRSILTLKNTPMEELKADIELSLRQDRALMTKAQERRSGSVIGAIRAGIDNAAVHEKVRIISQGVNLHLDPQVAEAIERVVREALRNAIEHAKARNIEINWRTTNEPGLNAGERERGRVSIVITDDGASSTTSNQSGIGTNLVMGQSIRTLGGSFAIEKNENESKNKTGTVVRIELPTMPLNESGDLLEFPRFSAIAHGRYMALLTLFGPAMTGVLFFPLLAIWWPGQYATQISGFLSLLALLYLVFVKRARLGWISSSLLGVGLLLVIASLDLDPLTCVSAQPFQWVINSVVYGLFIIMLWGKWQVTAISYPIFLYLVIPFHDLFPQNCNFIFNFPVLNTLFSFLFVWLVFFVVYRSVERVEKFQEARIEKNLLLIQDIERNDNAFEKILELDTLAQETIHSLSNSTGPISPEAQTALRRIDSQLRAEMQIDPVSSAGLTLLASDFVREVVSMNHWLDVKSIHGDEDVRPIPQLVRDRFLAIASDVPNGSLIQVVVNGERAELTLRCRTSVTDSMRAFVSTVEKLDEFGLHVEIDNKSADDEFVLFLRRERLSQ